MIATGGSHSEREFVQKVCELLNLNWKKYVEIDQRYLRPTEVDYLLGDPTKAKIKLGWQPKVNFEQLVRIMVESDLELAQKEAHLKGISKKGGGNDLLAK